MVLLWSSDTPIGDVRTQLDSLMDELRDVVAGLADQPAARDELEGLAAAHARMIEAVSGRELAALGRGIRALPMLVASVTL